MKRFNLKLILALLCCLVITSFVSGQSNDDKSSLRGFSQDEEVALSEMDNEKRVLKRKGKDKGGKGKKGKIPQTTCTMYEVSNFDLLKTTVIGRPERIDYLNTTKECFPEEPPFNVIGDFFCLGDTFATGAVPFYDVGGAKARGFYVVKGTRVGPASPKLENETVGDVVTYRDEILYFFDQPENGLGGVNQIGYSGLVVESRGQPYYYHINGGTGDYIGASGQVEINNFFRAPKNMTLNVCLLTQQDTSMTTVPSNIRYSELE